MPLIPNANPIELVIKDTIGRPQLNVYDSDGVLTNVDNVELIVMDHSGSTVVTDDFSVVGTRIVNTATGVYVFPFGDIAPNTETDDIGDYTFQWTITVSGESAVGVQVVKVVSVCAMSLLPYFKLLIDKSAKIVRDDPSNPCFLGYTNSQLMMYLEQGLSIINAYEPYPTFATLETFPLLFKHILFEAGLVAGVMSQQLFAIDEDIPNFSDQGNTFVIQHAPQLAQFLNQVTQRLDKLVPQMKLKLVNSGALHVQAGSNYRTAQLLQAAPNGALFRNLYFRG